MALNLNYNPTTDESPVVIIRRHRVAEPVVTNGIQLLSWHDAEPVTAVSLEGALDTEALDEVLTDAAWRAKVDRNKILTHFIFTGDGTYDTIKDYADAAQFFNHAVAGYYSFQYPDNHVEYVAACYYRG